MKISAIFFGALAGALISATGVAADVYECDIKQIDRGGGIAPVLIFAISDDGAEASVYDGYIKKYYGKPIDAKIVVANDKRYTFKWTVKMNHNLRGKSCRGSITVRPIFVKRANLSSAGFRSDMTTDMAALGPASEPNDCAQALQPVVSMSSHRSEKPYLGCEDSR